MVASTAAPVARRGGIREVPVKDRRLRPDALVRLALAVPVGEQVATGQAVVVVTVPRVVPVEPGAGAESSVA